MVVVVKIKCRELLSARTKSNNKQIRVCWLGSFKKQHEKVVTSREVQREFTSKQEIKQMYVYNIDCREKILFSLPQGALIQYRQGRTELIIFTVLSLPYLSSIMLYHENGIKELHFFYIQTSKKHVSQLISYILVERNKLE